MGLQRCDGGTVLAIVLGGGDSVWDDLQDLPVDPLAHTILAVNDAGIYWPHRLDHWVTMHAEELEHRKARRADRGHPDGYVTWTKPYAKGWEHMERLADRVMPGWMRGSSGMLAVGVALEVADHVVLCGVPMDDRPHFNRTYGWTACDHFRGAWVENEHKMRGRVRSMSGWTRDLLGGCDAEWLARATVSGVDS